MEKRFIDSIGLDGDGIINDLDFYQYAYGLPYFLSKYCKKNGIDIPNYLYDQRFYLSYTTDRDSVIDKLTRKLYCINSNLNINDVIKNPKAYDIQDIFGCTKLERQIFWLKHFPSYCTKYPIREKASYYINKWQHEGRKVHFITARAFVMNKVIGPKVRNAFENVLEENSIIPESITYCREKESPIDKEIACKKYGVMVMAEDKIENIKRLSSFIPVVSFAASYNQDYIGPNVIRTDNDFEGLDHFITNYEAGNYPGVKIKRR